MGDQPRAGRGGRGLSAAEPPAARIRLATVDDAAACAAVYAPYVETTAVTFETEPPDAEETARRIASAYLWLVAEVDGRVVGFLSAGPWKPRAAYHHTAETGIYLDAAYVGRGIGRALYVEAFDRLAERGFVTVVTSLVEPNPVSNALHGSLGFERVGTLRRVGWKLGAWHDVTIHQRML